MKGIFEMGIVTIGDAPTGVDGSVDSGGTVATVSVYRVKDVGKR